MKDIYRGDMKICQAKEAKNFFSRSLGLMFRGPLSEGEGLLIEFSPHLKSRSIHSFFMRFTIDLIFIDSRMKVVEFTTLRPWRMYNPKTECIWVLEVNKGTIEKNKIKIGDVLTFE
ncbi:DUF192 domain-containing protein [archaeon]|nr:DUF192 domain-containing protein [archaeon]